MLKHFLASCLFSLVFLIVSTGNASRADVIFDFAQQNATSEDTSLRRAVYLGRLFANYNPQEFKRIEGMWAGVTMAQAKNLMLYVGDGSSGFDSLLAQNKMIDTGLRFTTVSQQDTEVVFVPGKRNETGPFLLPTPTGLAMHDFLVNNKRLDFWIVGAPGDGFTIPSTFGETTPVNFVVHLQRTTSVPEPSSILLGVTGLVTTTSIWLRKRRSRK